MPSTISWVSRMAISLSLSGDVDLFKMWRATTGEKLAEPAQVSETLRIPSRPRIVAMYSSQLGELLGISASPQRSTYGSNVTRGGGRLQVMSSSLENLEKPERALDSLAGRGHKRGGNLDGRRSGDGASKVLASGGRRLRW
jgi:hypothetical protein